MKMYKYNYFFNIRKSLDVALTISIVNNKLGYQYIDINKVLDAYNVKEEDVNGLHYISKILGKVENKHNDRIEDINNMCNALSEKWNQFKDEYFKCLEQAIGVEFDNGQIFNTFCYLHFLPINEISQDNNIIILDCNKNIDELFKTFIIMLTKTIILDRSKELKPWTENSEYEAKNKIWQFAEIAVDAVFANTDLSKFCSAPSYKYFYSLNIDGVNFMNEFRKLHKLVSWDDFYKAVYMFVHENSKTIITLKNYLY